MKKFAELGHVYRSEPCQEYPGSWRVYWDKHETIFAEKEDAFNFANNNVAVSGYDAKICWRCSEDDPRIGQVWFTGFYCHSTIKAR